MKTFEQKLDQYAELVVKIGLNIQEGQRLLILSPIEAKDFTRKVTKHAYDNGCKHVFVNWNDSATSRLHLEGASEETLKDNLQPWDVDKLNSLAEHNDAMLNITGDDPNAFSGVAPERLMWVQKDKGEKLQAFSKAQLNGDMHWAIAGVPTSGWAKSVFPELSEQEAIDALWEAIFKTVRIDQEDPVAAWEEHTNTLTEKVNYLNEKQFKTLHYKSEGTDLSIDLHPDHLWIGGGHNSTIDTSYIPNLPTEEVFTTPLKNGVNGTVASKKPLSAMGNLIDNFSLTFKDGKVVDFSAEKGYETLEQLLNIDDGMKYLGEVALVPYDSPISNSGIIFNNTLYDENAACHLAIGTSITMSVKEVGHLQKEELEEIGVNQSRGHTDFMIGSADLDIVAETQEGEKVQLFKDGNWAI
ncbi:aminopeptidase [Pseudalkalibacillus berkeleyi]|uniref:Aminopeptidase n=1 Tax=Pseudalkalibacillus berkeleyi TaxID=1069813 RepID=A0ABS9GYW6_9BACL|nr:aminopeptidase [Pseudalkalibacillus berkeleyi]MCF6136688.1 aminopeptidase [Pseudalkalibacillus berkeleyi]